MDSNDDDEEIMDIDDFRVPEAIRAHSARFRKPVRFVVSLGNGEYILAAEDGEIADFVYQK